MKLTEKCKILNYFFIRSISFYPSLISLLFLGFALFLLPYEKEGLSLYLHEKLGSIIVTHNVTARAVSSAIINGLISLTVFSFTMVMVVLNQTGTNYSPRIIPGLITYRSHQIVLGFYLGTIIYSLLILMNLESRDMGSNVPGTAILLDVFFGVICLGLFVYFMHSISKSIQIENIMERLYNDTLKELKKDAPDESVREETKKAGKSIGRVKDWFPIESTESGFLQDIDEEELVRTAEKHDVIIIFISPPGFYINRGSQFVLINRPWEAEGPLCDEITKSLSFKQEELVALNYLYGFKQLSEIAVKSLSPGINDPGTAVRAMYYLNDLLAERITQPDTRIYFDSNKNPRVVLNRLSLKDMLSFYMSPLRNYGKKDLTITRTMLELIRNLMYASRKNNSVCMNEIVDFLNSVTESADRNITNSSDRRVISGILEKINSEGFYEQKFVLNVRKEGDS